MDNPLMIVGLGNPGPKYSETRHNAGFWFLDRLHSVAAVPFRSQRKLKAEVAVTAIDGRDCILVRPETFMNESGQAVRAVMDYYKVNAAQVLVAYDELDLPPGTARLKQGGGHGGHNGIRDILKHTDMPNFLRLRIGIGHPGSKDAVTPYVLGRPSADEERMIRQSIGDALEALPLLLAGDTPAAMKKLHTR